MPEHKPRKIAVLTLSDPFVSCKLIEGVGDYAAELSWSVSSVTESDLRNAHQLRAAQWDGLIVRSMSDPAISDLLTTGLNIIHVEPSGAHRGTGVICPDNRRIGQLGFEHIGALGFPHYVFVGVDALWSRQRQEGFATKLASANLSHETILLPACTDWHGMLSRPIIAHLLEHLIPPVAVMAANDTLAGQVVRVCRQLGWSVPEDVAILGVDNYTSTCQAGDFDISSVDPNHRLMGRRAAELLDRQFQNQPLPMGPVLVEPIGVVSRSSTAAKARQDRDVVRAMQFIQRRAKEGISVEDVSEAVGMGRKTLERRFHRALGYPPGEEIRRVRLDHAAQMIRQSDHDFADIAYQVGFSSVAHFSTAFKRRFSMTPSEYRRRTTLTVQTLG